MYLCYFYDYCCCCCCCCPLLPTYHHRRYSHASDDASACADDRRIWNGIIITVMCFKQYDNKNFVVNKNDALGSPDLPRLIAAIPVRTTPISIMVWTNNNIYSPDASAERFIGFRRIWTQWWIWIYLRCKQIIHHLCLLYNSVDPSAHSHSCVESGHSFYGAATSIAYCFNISICAS